MRAAPTRCRALSEVCCPSLEDGRSADPWRVPASGASPRGGSSVQPCTCWPVSRGRPNRSDEQEPRAGFAHEDTAHAKLDKLDAVLEQSFTPPQDAALLAELLSLPNDGRYPTL